MATETIETTSEAPPAPAATTEAPPAAPAVNEDDISLDEQVLATLPPEIRQTVVDPLIAKVKTQVSERMKKKDEEFQPFKQKAETFEQLLKQPWFQAAYRQSINPQPVQQTQPNQPKPAVSNEELMAAYEKAAQGDFSQINALQEKNIDALILNKYAPVVQQMQKQQQEMKMTMEMNDLFTNHPDAKELDSIRMDSADPRSPSLLEFALHYVSDKGGKSFEDAYQAANKMAAQMKAIAKKEALGMVNGKKQSVTEVPKATTVGEESVIYVDSPREALQSQIKATLSNQNVTYRVRPRQK